MKGYGIFLRRKSKPEFDLCALLSRLNLKIFVCSLGSILGIGQKRCCR